MSIVELAGGVGGARLAHGLAAHLGPALTVVVNTGDDLERHGLHVSPDHDTVMYTLAGLDNRTFGWGVEGETFTVSEWLERYGEETWFRLGDRDLAAQLVRTSRLRAGERLTDVSRRLQRSLGVRSVVLPMSDDPVRTDVRTPEGWIEFQEYFVHRRQEPTVLEVRFRGIEAARPTAEVLAAIATAEAIIVAPSNPIVSIAPILALPAIREALEAVRADGRRIVAVSPIVAGRALKGPADRMLASLGHEPSALGVARMYADLATDFVLDRQDAELVAPIEALGLRGHVRDTIMAGDDGRTRLAGDVLAIARAAAATTR